MKNSPVKHVNLPQPITERANMRYDHVEERQTGEEGSVPGWILTWGRGRRRARPAAGCGPCWGWSGPDTEAACVRCTRRCLRPPAESPACPETARSRTSSPPGDKQQNKTKRTAGVTRWFCVFYPTDRHSRAAASPPRLPSTARCHCSVRVGPGSSGTFQWEWRLSGQNQEDKQTQSESQSIPSFSQHWNIGDEILLFFRQKTQRKHF